MKTAAVLAGAIGAQAAMAQVDPPAVLSTLAVESNTNSSVFATIAGEQIADSFQQNLEDSIVVPDPWQLDIENSLRIGNALGDVRSESDVSASAFRVDGTYSATTSATTADESILPSTRLDENFQIAARDLNVIADIVLTINGSASVGGFGTSILSWAFLTDGRGESGTIRPDEPGGGLFVFEDINLSRFEFTLDTRLSAGLDAPVLNSDASVQLDWSIEILPIPAPGAGALLAAAGAGLIRRRRGTR